MRHSRINAASGGGNEGLGGFKIDDRKRAEYMECLELLAPHGVSVRDAVRHYLATAKVQEASRPVAEAVAAFLKAKEQDGASARYLGDCRARLNRFSGKFGDVSLAAVSAADLDEWLRGLEVGIVTRNTFQRRLLALYEWARGLGYVTAFPLRGVKKAREPKPKAMFLTATEVSRLLTKATVGTRPFWVIAIFAGLRPESEMQRLRWEDVNLGAGVIVVPEKDEIGHKPGRT